MRGAKLSEDNREDVELALCRRSLQQRDLSDNALIDVLVQAGAEATAALRRTGQQIEETPRKSDTGAPPDDEAVPAVADYNAIVLACYAALEELKLRSVARASLWQRIAEMPVLVAALAAAALVEIDSLQADRTARQYVDYKSGPSVEVDMLAMEVQRNCRLALWYLKHGNYKEYLSVTGPERFWENS